MLPQIAGRAANAGVVWRAPLSMPSSLAMPVERGVASAPEGFPHLAGFEQSVTSMTVADAAADSGYLETLSFTGDLFLNLLSFLMLCRVVISWYPKTDLASPPFSFVVFPTEWLLRPTRSIVPPAFGVDISPIVWLAVTTFLHEIFLGQQGLLTLKMKYGM